ncbi:MAG: GAF domain-containing sensor histidine kinase [Gemmatimonadaceae bacterium]|nr:GAF domain-containing sensor histidine kinase [Gemmatimonadaceae bacterium]
MSLGSTDGHGHALLEAQKDSLELVVTGAPLTTVLDHLTRTVETQSGGAAVAAIMLLDDDGRLRSTSGPSLPAHYQAAVDGIPANPDVGTCAAAAARAEVVITPDFATDPAWTGLSHLPLGIGFTGAWSMPIIGRTGRVLGTFGTYFRERREPTARERAVVEILARTAAIAIERDRADAATRAQTEELRVAKEAAEAASHAKGQFLAVVSHELRTPLTGIIGYADLLRSGIAGPMDGRQTEHVQRIERAAWHLVEIIDEILTYSRIEAGREVAALAEVDVTQLVDECAALLRPAAVAKGVSLRVLGDAGPVMVATDPGKVRQVVLNLAGNALKFTNSGVVEVSTGVVGSQVRIQVRDSGCGIPGEKQQVVFDAFVQAEEGHTRTSGGTGLGLTVSRRLAEILGGSVTLDASAPGQGSTFTFTLPRGRVSAPPPGRAPDMSRVAEAMTTA